VKGYNFIHQSQLGSLKFKATSDAGIMLTHFICMGWIRNLSTSTLKKVGFDPKVVCFFLNYLISRKTHYFWNSFFFHFFNVDIGVEQGSALSPILSALYLALIFHILKNCLKILKILVSILSFVNNGLFIK